MSQAVLKWFRPEVSKWLRRNDLSPTISNVRKAILAIRKEGERLKCLNYQRGAKIEKIIS